MVPHDDNGASHYNPPNEWGEPPPPPPLAPRLRTSVLDEHIDNLQAEVTELRAQLANKRTELEALWNECRGAPPSTRPLRSACSTPTRSDHACTHIPCTATVLQCYPLKPARPRCTTTRLAPTMSSEPGW